MIYIIATHFIDLQQILYKISNLGLFCQICHDIFGTEYFNGHDKNTEINKFYNEYLTLKKLNLKTVKNFSVFLEKKYLEKNNL